ncbi:MAG: DNA polymerase III subunit alpha [Bacillota bacterium]|jgi:DNA polymerase-3 subunit alpha|nr:DNA polymerase III subunit alpha [Candidatus Fermentithermobacillaceae bacterium]
MSKFCHLHVHTEYSLLDGACRIHELCQMASRMGMEALAITDHGAMYGVIDFYNACLEAGLRPIIGCEIYVARGSRLKKDRGLRDEPYHLVLLAETDEGYRNLLKIVSTGFLDGFYYKPRVDLEILSKYSKGLIALTACLDGEVPRLVRRGRFTEASASLGQYTDIFGKHNVFLELQRNGIAAQEQVNQGLVELSRRHRIPIVATNDCHYLRQSDARHHEILLAIQTGTNIYDPNRLRFEGDQFYLKSPGEMAGAFSDLPEAITNTGEVARRCNVTLDLSSIHLPDYPIPQGETASSYLRKQAQAGLVERLGGRVSPAKQERLEYELKMIDVMGYSSYFLIVADFVGYAKRQGIAVGPGRGSAAGSLVAYSLGITGIDPVDHDLVFERFLNPERVSMPDIDIDFQDDRRDEVIEYVRGKYGSDRVAQIITFGTMAARAVIRDVGRALNLPYAETDTIAKMIPAQPGITIAQAIETVPDLRQAMQRDEIRSLIETAQKLEGMPRHSSVHAAGVVIGKEPLWEYVPLGKTQDGVITTQYPMEALEALGLLKMDFLGLRTLTVIQKATRLAGESAGKPLDIEQVPLDNEETYEMLARGESLGVFQLESSWVRDFLKEMKPREFKDIVAAVALCRPGPMEQIPEYIRARFGKPHYLHPVLEPVLRETYGVMVYQEQILQIAHRVAGLSLGEADILRRAVGKKDLGLLVQMQDKFLEGAINNGISRACAQEIWDLILKFANYGFNKNHAAPYALVAYWTAYLKAQYPAAFMAALLSSVRGIQGKVGIYLDEVKRLGIGIKGPSVNHSLVEFSVETTGDSTAIRYGLGGIKNVGEAVAAEIVKERQFRGRFESLESFVFRMGRNVTKKALESLIRCGTLDELGTRFAHLNRLEEVLNQRATQPDTQMSLFGGFEAPRREQHVEPRPRPAAGGSGQQLSLFSQLAVSSQPVSGDTVPLEVRLSWERDLLGMYFSGHPLDKYREYLRRHTVSLADIDEVPDRAEVTVGGRVSSVKKIITRAGEEMAFISLEDEYDSIEVIVFPRVWQQARGFLAKDRIVIARGNIEEHEGIRRLLARDCYEIDSAKINADADEE